MLCLAGTGILVLLGLSAGCYNDSAQGAKSPTPFDAELFKPRGVDVGPSGRIYVIDMAGFVTRFSCNGHFERRWEMPEHDTGTPSGLFVDQLERVIVADTHNSRIIIYDADGNESARFGRLGTGAGQFLYPNDVVVDRDGFLYVTEYGGNDRISKFTPDYQYVKSIGGHEDAAVSLAFPYGLTLDGEETLWVADTGNHRLCRFDHEGRLLQTIGGVGDAPGEMRYPYDVSWIPRHAGVSAGNAGCLLVCEKGNHRVQMFECDGSPFDTWGEPGRGGGQLDSPAGLKADGDRILVADTGNNRLVTIPLASLTGRSNVSPE